MQHTRSAEQEAPVQRDTHDQVQDRDHDDEQSGRDVGRVREHRVQVAQEEEEGQAGASKGQEKAERRERDQSEPLGGARTDGRGADMEGYPGFRLVEHYERLVGHPRIDPYRDEDPDCRRVAVQRNDLDR